MPNNYYIPRLTDVTFNSADRITTSTPTDNVGYTHDYARYMTPTVPEYTSGVEQQSVTAVMQEKIDTLTTELNEQKKLIQFLVDTMHEKGLF